MSGDAQLFFGTDGRVRAIYQDDIVPELAAELGAASTRRASSVEPAPGGWTADLAASGGGVLGPFELRRDALAAEVDWLQNALRAGSEGA